MTDQFPMDKIKSHPTSSSWLNILFYLEMSHIVKVEWFASSSLGVLDKQLSY